MGVGIANRGPIDDVDGVQYRAVVHGSQSPCLVIAIVNQPTKLKIYSIAHWTGIGALARNASVATSKAVGVVAAILSSCDDA